MTKPINYVIALAILGVLATLSVILPIYMDDLVYRVLMLSGIGPADHLGDMGVEVVRDSPEVGANLQDHYILTMSWRLRQGAYSYNQQLSGMRLLGNVMRYLARRDGAMTIPAAQVGAFVKSDPALDRPRLQL